MRDQIPTVRTREIGAELKRVRERAGYNQAALARLLGWSSSRISRLEQGTRGISETNVALWLGVCKAKRAESQWVLWLCREPYQRSWLRSHGVQSHDALSTLTLQETTAARIREYEPLVVPSLLQTADYARALFDEAGLVPKDALDLWVQARMDRQGIFRQRQGPMCLFYVSELGLRWQVGDARVMNDQLQHLVLVSSLPSCAIRILPADAGFGDLLIEPFRLMEYTEYRPCVYIRHFTTSLFLEEPDDIRAYRAALDRMDQSALDAHQSRELLQALACEYDVPSTTSDDNETITVDSLGCS